MSLAENMPKRNLYHVVKKNIDKLDVLNLLEHGAPSDEFDSEIREICSRILHDKPDSKEKIIKIIQKVFDRTMDVKLTEERLTGIADEIYSVLIDFPKEGDVYVEPFMYTSIQEIWDKAKKCTSSSDLAKIYATAHNEYFLIAHEMDDFESGINNHQEIDNDFNEWKDLYEFLQEKVIQRAQDENLINDKHQNVSLTRQLEPFMNKYGYEDGNGWWCSSTITS